MQGYEVINSHVRDERDAPRDDDIYYHCRKCGSAISSVSRDNIGCKCGNIFLDVDYIRLIVKDFSLMEILRGKIA